MLACVAGGAVVVAAAAVVVVVVVVVTTTCPEIGGSGMPFPYCCTMAERFAMRLVRQGKGGSRTQPNKKILLSSSSK